MTRGVPAGLPTWFDDAMTWLDLDPADPFGVATLPYGVIEDGPAVRIGRWALPLRAATAALLPERAELFAAATLDPFLAAGPAVWAHLAGT